MSRRHKQPQESYEQLVMPVDGHMPVRAERRSLAKRGLGVALGAMAAITLIEAVQSPDQREAEPSIAVNVLSEDEFFDGLQEELNRLTGNGRGGSEIELPQDTVPLNEVKGFAFDARRLFNESKATANNKPAPYRMAMSEDDFVFFKQVQEKLRSQRSASSKGGGSMALTGLDASESQRYKGLIESYAHRDVQERVNTERLIGLNNAEFIRSVHTSSGIAFNFYAARPDDRKDLEVMISPKMLDVLTTFQTNQLENLGPQPVLSKAEVDRIITKARSGNLDATVTVIMADNINDCILNGAKGPKGAVSPPSEADGLASEMGVLGSPTDERTCYGAGTNDDLSSMQDSKTNDFRNPTIMLGRQPKAVPGKTNDIQEFFSVFTHEFGHALVGMSTLDMNQRIYDDSPKKDTWEWEHKKIVTPMQNYTTAYCALGDNNEYINPFDVTTG